MHTALYTSGMSDNTHQIYVYKQINPCQNGFVPKKSCITQLIQVLDHIGRKLDCGKQIDVCYLDMSKAFDKVSRTKLLVRLREFGFAGSILKWFGSYLTSRYQQTTVLGAVSRPLPVSSGVPQGSILGPLPFLLYENHLSNDVTNSRIATFADDTKIFKTINSKSDALSLQNDLSNFHESSSSINLELINTKCKVLRVTRRHNKLTYPYKLNNTILESTDCERDLGVLTSSTLTWSQQVDYLYVQQSHQNVRICPTINVKYQRYHSSSQTIFMPCSFTALLWIPNLGTTICSLSQTYGITSKTCNKIHPKFALPL